MIISLWFVAFIAVLFMFFYNKAGFIIMFTLCSLLFVAAFSIKYGGVTFSFLRVGSVFYFLLIVLFYGINSSLLVKYKYYYFGFLLIFIFQLLSSVLSDVEANQYVLYLVDDFFQTIGLLYIVSFVVWVMRKNSGTIILMYSLSLYLSILLMTAFVELMFQKNILQMLGLLSEVSENYKYEAYKGSNYRVSSVIGSPLGFGFSIVLIYPTCLYLYYENVLSDFKRHLNIFNVLMSPILLYYTYSRTSLFVFFILIFFVFALYYMDNEKNNYILKYLLGFFFLLLSIGMISNFANIFDIVNAIANTGETYETDSSLRARSLQYNHLIHLIESGEYWFGYGRVNTMNLIERIDQYYKMLSLDSLYLKYFFEGGLIPMLTYFAIVFFTIVRIWFSRLYLFDKYMLISFISYFMISVFSSSTDPRLIFIILLVVLVEGRGELRKMKDKRIAADRWRTRQL